MCFVLLFFFICIVILACPYFKVKARLIFFLGSRCELPLLLIHIDTFAHQVSAMNRKLSWVCCRDEQAEGQPVGCESPSVLELKELYAGVPTHTTAALILSREFLGGFWFSVSVCSCLFLKWERKPSLFSLNASALYLWEGTENPSHPIAPSHVRILVYRVLAPFNPAEHF